MKTYWTTSIFLYLCIKSAVSLEDDNSICQRINNSNGETYELYCPYISHPLAIHFVITSTTVEVTCEGDRKSLSVPPLTPNLKGVTYVRINNCQLPENISDLLRAWNITDLHKFALSNCSLPNATITAEFFRDFPKHNLQRLHLKMCGIEHVEADALAGFDSLEILDFESNNISVVTDFFKEIPNLKKVDLQNNLIVELPEVITSPKLTTLYLQSNKIENLTSKVFSRATNISLLELSSNNLKHLPEDVLHPLRNLRHVAFGLGGELNITSNFFRENGRLETLRFRGGNITYLASDTFDSLQSMTSLSIYLTELGDLRLGTFEKTYSLRKLILAENRLRVLPDGLFRNLNNLTDLDLTGNNLTSFPKSDGGLQNLTKLTLDRNGFEAIESMSFAHLPKLARLSLARNKIRTISINGFDQESSITDLNLSFNPIELTDFDYEYVFSRLTNLRLLSLKNTSMTKLPWLTSGYIRSLDLSNNNLTSIDVKDITRFAYVDLSGNQIEHVSFFIVDFAYIGNEPHTLRLNINNNPILCDCTTADLIRFLSGAMSTNVQRYIEISADKTVCAGDHIGTPVKNLTLADLTCKLNSPPDCYENCVCSHFPVNRTLEIDCSNLNLTEAPQNITFKPYNFIQAGTVFDKCVLNLNNNRISRLDRNDNYENITALYLSNNNVSEIDWLPPNLEVLRLDNNAFSNVGRDGLALLEANGKLRSLTMHGNPWNCNCSLVGFTNSLRVNLSGKLENKHDLLCSDGEHNLYNMSESELCADSVVIPILYALLVIFLSLIAILMILYHIYEQSVKIWLYDRSIFLWFVTEEDLDKDKEYDAFVSYSHKDEDFIEKHLVPELERDKENPYRLCIHNRDWIVGEFITLQIIESVKKSRRTIIVLSKNFMESTWAAMEFRTAYEEAMREKRNRIILVVYDDIDLTKIDDVELKNYIQTNTYIKWGDPWFWKRLRYAMPHRNKRREAQKNTRIDNMMISIDEKIDLTDAPTTPNTQTPPAISADPLLLKVSPLQFKLSKEGKTTPPAECGMVATHIC